MPAGGGSAPEVIVPKSNFTITGELDFAGVGAVGKFNGNLAALRSGKRAVDGDPEPAQKFSRRDFTARDGTGQRAEQVRRAISPIVSRWGAAAPEVVVVMAEKDMGRGIVTRLVAAIRRFLRSIGFDLEFSERELRDLIGKSARYLRNGRRPRIAPVSDPAMSFAAHPDRDWDARVPVVGVAGGAFGDTAGNLTQARKAAQNYLTRLRDSGRLMTNADTGWKIGLSAASIRELTQFDREKLNLLLALPRITNVAVLADSSPAQRDADTAKKSVKAFHTFYAPVALNGHPRIARLVVREDVNGNYAYDLQQSTVLNDGSPAFAGPRQAGVPRIEGGAGPSMTVGQLRDAVNAINHKGWAFSQSDSQSREKGVEFTHAEEALQSRLAQWSAALRLGRAGPRAVESRPESIGSVHRNEAGAAKQGDATREEIREQSARLIERAKAGGYYWPAGSQIIAEIRKLKALGGSEHQVFLAGDGDNRFVIRATDNGLFGPRADISPAQYLARLDDYSNTFPSLQTRLIGISESPDIPGHAVIWTAQPFVRGKKFGSQRSRLPPRTS